MSTDPDTLAYSGFADIPPAVTLVPDISGILPSAVDDACDESCTLVSPASTMELSFPADAGKSGPIGGMNVMSTDPDTLNPVVRVPAAAVCAEVSVPSVLKGVAVRKASSKAVTVRTRKPLSGVGHSEESWGALSRSQRIAAFESCLGGSLSRAPDWEIDCHLNWGWKMTQSEIFCLLGEYL